MIPAVARLLFLPTLFTRKSERQWGHRQGQEVSRAERAEREERPARLTSCPQDTRPTPLARSQAPSSQSCAAAGRLLLVARPPAPDVPAWTGTSTAGLVMINNSERSFRLLTTDPIPLNPLGLWAILRSFRFPSLSYRRCASFSSNAQRLSMRYLRLGLC